jgi:hypothetical protein
VDFSEIVDVFRRNPGRPSKQGFNSRTKFFGIERFGQIVVGSDAETADFVGGLIARREHQNGNGYAFVPKTPAHVKNHPYRAT